MKVEVSDGELVDKYSVLCIKAERIHDPDKRLHVSHEKSVLDPLARPLLEKWPAYYALLCRVNTQIWDKTDEVKSLDPAADPVLYASLASEIFQLNDQRFRLKRVFNIGRGIQEQKSYAGKVAHVRVGGGGGGGLEDLVRLVPDYDLICIYGSDESIMAEVVRHVPLPCVAWGGQDDAAAETLTSCRT